MDAICSYLNIRTKISSSSEYELTGDKSERLANLCKQALATEYISGPAAKNCIESEVFGQNNIQLTWFNYSNYREYNQLWGHFTHKVFILDLFFNCGKLSSSYLNFRH